MGDRLFTIGFTQKSAEKFFGLLIANGVTKLIDTRLNNTGQLAGFSKKDDLAYFAKTIAGIEYVHWQQSAPEEEALKAYKDKKMSWDDYEGTYLATIARRRVEQEAEQLVGPGACLLCSEATPHRCHRRILANYLASKLLKPIEVRHL